MVQKQWLSFNNDKLSSVLFTSKKKSMTKVTWWNQTANLSSISQLLNYSVSPLIAINLERADQYYNEIDLWCIKST